jgi:hypothetical protein
MRHEILPNGNLRISASPEDQALLKIILEERGEEFDTDSTLHEALEWLVCNSDLSWCRSEVIGAFTSAPVLAVFGERRPLAVGEAAGRGNRLSALRLLTADSSHVRLRGGECNRRGEWLAGGVGFRRERCTLRRVGGRTGG